MSHVEFFRIEHVLEAFVLREDCAFCTIKVMPPNLQSKNHYSQSEVVRGILDLVVLKMSRGIVYDLSLLHKNAT